MKDGTREVVVVVAAAVGLSVLLASCDSGGSGKDVTAEAAGQPAQSPPTVASTSLPSTTATTGAATTTTSTPPGSAATASTVTSTTVARPGFTVTTSPAGESTEVELAGTGCLGPNAGVSLEIRNPADQPFTGDGAAAMADGRWELREVFGASYAPGRYAFVAVCNAEGRAPLQYERQYFDWKG